MKNEPVAVVDHRQQNGVTWLKIKKGRAVMPDHNTLLYTHPAKTLTDEEIDIETTRALNDLNGSDYQLIDVAQLIAKYLMQAILRKAQEK